MNAREWIDAFAAELGAEPPTDDEINADPRPGRRRRPLLGADRGARRVLGRRPRRRLARRARGGGRARRRRRLGRCGRPGVAIRLKSARTGGTCKNRPRSDAMATEEKVTYCRICEPLCGMVATVDRRPADEGAARPRPPALRAASPARRGSRWPRSRTTPTASCIRCAAGADGSFERSPGRGPGRDRRAAGGDPSTRTAATRSAGTWATPAPSPTRTRSGSRASSTRSARRTPTRPPPRTSPTASPPAPCSTARRSSSRSPTSRAPTSCWWSAPTRSSRTAAC